MTAPIPSAQEDKPAGLWSYRCDCGKKFTNTYGSGSAYCPRLRCQRVCFAISKALPLVSE